MSFTLIVLVRAMVLVGAGFVLGWRMAIRRERTRLLLRGQVYEVPSSPRALDRVIRKAAAGVHKIG